MTRTSAALGIALAVSVGLNFWQYARGGDRRATADAPPRSMSKAKAAAPATPVRLRNGADAPAATDPVEIPMTDAATCHADLQACAGSLADVEQRYRKAAAEVDDFMPIQVRFDRGVPNPDLEAELGPLVAPAFDSQKNQVDYDLECRESVCKVSFAGKDGFDYQAVMDHMQRGGKISERTNEMLFTSGHPTNDAVTGESLTTHEIMFRARTEEVPSGMEILQEVVGTFMASDARSSCYGAHPATGVATIRLALAPDAPSITVEVGGSLGAMPAGTCLRERLEAVAGAAQIPAHVSGAVRYFSVSLP